MSQLEFYWKLSSNDKAERMQAAVGLVEFIAPGVESDDLDYALKRHFYCLSINHTRIYTCAVRGWIFVCLVTKKLLNRVPASVKVARILELLEEYTFVTAGLKGREERDLVFGRLFGLHALAQSSLLIRATLVDLEKIVKDLLRLAGMKAYFRESCYSVLIAMLSASTSFTAELQKMIVDATLASGIDTPESLWLALSCEQLSIDISDAVQEKRWKSKRILATENVDVLGEILKETTFAHPHVHAVWGCVVDGVFDRDELSMHDFWNGLVEGPLLSSTHERKFLAFQLFILALPRLTSSTLPILLTPAFMRTFTNNLSSPKNYLHKASKQIAQKMQELARTNKALGLQIVLGLSGASGSGVQEFDRVTKSKTVEGVLAGLDLQGVEGYIAHLAATLKSAEGDEVTVKRNQTWALGQMYTLVKNGSVPKSESLVCSVMEIFVAHAYSDSVHQQDALTKLSGMLTDLLNISVATLKVSGMASGESWASIVVSHASFIAHCNADEELKASLAVSTNIRKQIASMRNASNDVTESEKKRQQKLAVYEGLVSHATFMSTIDTELSPVISELDACFNRLFAKVLAKRKHESAVDEDEEELNPHDVLLDILINFLSRPSALLRGVSESVFKMFCGGISQRGVELLFEVLEGKQDEQSEQEESGEEEEGDDQDSQEESDESEEETAESESEEDEDSVAKLKALITASMPGLLPTSDQDSDTESFLGDDDMQPFDDKLTEIFKHRKTLSNQKKTEQNLVAHFKTRLLDLVDIFVRKQEGNGLIVKMIVPLLRLSLKSSGEFMLHEKLSGLLKGRLGKVKDAGTVALEEGLEVLREIHAIAARSSEQAYLKMCSGLCKVVTRSIIAHPLSAVVEEPVKKKSKSKSSQVAILKVDETKIRVEAILAIYTQSLTQKMTKKQSQLTQEFFADYCKAFNVIGWRVCREVAGLMTLSAVCNGYQLVEGAKIILSMTLVLSKKELTEEDRAIVESVLAKMRASLTNVFAKDAETKSELEKKAMGAGRVKELLKILGQIERKAKSVGAAFDVAEFRG